MLVLHRLNGANVKRLVGSTPIPRCSRFIIVVTGSVRVHLCVGLADLSVKLHGDTRYRYTLSMHYFCCDKEGKAGNEGEVGVTPGQLG